MQSAKLYIPKKICVGFQKRTDTYTGQLGYVVYYDHKGVLRKENSWNTWRDREIAPQEFENVPTEGFVLNKGVGGVRQSYGWNARNEYIRVYDPRGHEFEISVANLLFILREGDCSRGKGLHGKFVYAWDRQELVLLPCDCEDYKKSEDFTDLQQQTLSVDALIPGATYLSRKQEAYVYLGKFNDYALKVDNWTLRNRKNFYPGKKPPIKKRHVFLSVETQTYMLVDKLDRLAVCSDATPAPQLSEWVQTYYKSEHGSPVIRLELQPLKRPIKEDDTWRFYYQVFAYQAEDGSYVLYRYRSGYTPADKTQERTLCMLVKFVDGYLQFKIPDVAVSHGSYLSRLSHQNRDKKTAPYVNCPEQKLVAVLESGSRFEVLSSCALAVLEEFS